MSDILEKQEEMIDKLGGMSAELVRATKDAKKLRAELLNISGVVESKNYEILSRFLSGTGAWRILNKFKATVQTLGQLLNISEDSVYKEAATLQGIAKMEERRAKFAQLSEIAAKAESGDRRAIAEMMEQLPEVKGLASMIGEERAIKRYRKFVDKANDGVLKTMKSLGGKGFFGDLKDRIKFGSDILDRQEEEKKQQKIIGDSFYDMTLEEDRKKAQRPMQILKRLLTSPIKSISDKVSFFFSPSRYKERQKAFAKVGETVKKIGLSLSKFFIGFALLALGAFALFKLLKSEEFLSDMKGVILDFFDIFAYLFSEVYSGIMLLVDGFRTGDFFTVIQGVAKITLSLIGIALTALGVVIVGAVMLVFSILKVTIKAILTRMASSLDKAASTLLYIGAAIAFIVAAFSTVPVAIGLAVAGAIAALLGRNIDKRGKTTYAEAIPRPIRAFSKGGLMPRTGLALVGEDGAELVRLPAGARVFSNKQSQNIANGTTNITVQVSGRVGASDQEIKDIARKVSREIGLQMNRTGSTAVRF